MSSTQSSVLPKKGLSLAIALSLYGLSVPVFATQAFEFNTDVLDLEDKNNIDLNQFSRAGYIMPGTYSFTLYPELHIILFCFVVCFLICNCMKMYNY